MDSICKCNGCDEVFIDTNPQSNSKKFDFNQMFMTELVSHKCPICGTDAFLTDMDNQQIAKYLWDRLGDVAVNNDDEIEVSFLQFEVGTPKIEIWSWFEEELNVSVTDLMFYK